MTEPVAVDSGEILAVSNFLSVLRPLGLHLGEALEALLAVVILFVVDFEELWVGGTVDNAERVLDCGDGKLFTSLKSK